MSLLTKFAEQMAKLKLSVEKAREWFAKKTKTITGNQIMADNSRLASKDKISSNIIGRMVMYYYDPKYKETLPYYDRFPLSIIVSINKDGFAALNLHYLPINIRARFLNNLYTVYNNKQLNEKKKLQLTYEILRSTNKLRYFKPCYKNYLFKHVKSRFYIVHPEEWDMVLTLPTERFAKKRKEYVWNESRKKLGIY